MTLDQFRTWIAPISQTVAVLVAVGGLVWWGASLQSRVATLENQIYAVLIAPKTISPPQSQPQPGPASGNNSGPIVEEGGVAYSEQNFKPLATACFNLIEDMNMALAQHTKKGDQAAAAIKNLASDLKC